MKALFHYTLLSIMTVLFAVNVAWAQPANDDCANAVTLTVGATCVTTAGTTVLATESIAPITCAGFAATTALDVWYKFVATAANLNVTVVGDVNFDAVIDVRSGACNGTNIACADATVSGGTEVAALTGLSIGTTYYVRLYDYSGTATFTICVATPPMAPANDNCAGAIAFPTIPTTGVCTSLTGNTAAATQSQTACAGSGADDDIWFSFVAPASTILVELTAISGSTDRVHQIFSGSCGSLVSVKCSDPETSTTAGLTVGATYYVRVHTYGTGTSTEFNICLKTPPPPPANDNCASAIAFPTIPNTGACATLTGNTAGATQSQAACVGSGADDDIWYSFVAPASTILVELTAISGSTDRVHQIFSGSCGSLVSVKCSDPETSTTTGLTIGATYYIRVHTYSTGNSTEFNICLKTPAPPPVNDECANATPLTVFGMTCGGATTGSTAGATQSIPAISCASFTGTADDDVWYSFVATSSSHNVTVVGASSFDAVVDVRSGACNGTNIGCADATISGGTEVVTLTSLSIGATYYVRVYTYLSTPSTTPTFTICVTTPTPPCNAPGIPSAGNVNTTSATLSWPAAAGALTYDWTSGTGASCPTGTGGNTAATSVNLNGLTPNTTYRFCVRTSTCGGGASSGYVTTTFTTAPLPNDACAGAQTITCGSTINGSTVGAASDAAVGSCAIGSGNTPGNGVWYKLVGNGAQVTASLCGSAYDTKIHVYTGTCAGLTCLVSNDDNNACGSGSTRSQVIFNANVGTDYYILVSGFATTTGAFSLNLTCLCGPALGAPWTVTNIGASNGGAIENVCDGTIDVKATNYGSPTNDVQTYAWQQMCGNGFIKAKVENVTNGGWGGIMFRENNAGGSKKIALRTQLTNNVIRDLRAATNGVAQQQQFPKPNAPQWLRLTRNGNVFLGETSNDGVNWDYTFSVNLVLPSCIEVGLFSQSINVNTTVTAVFSNIMGVATSPPVIPLVDGSNGNVGTQEVLSLFPNPATDEINVKMEAFYGKNVTISVQNQLGQVVLQRDIDDVQDATERIELNNMPSGIYNLTVRTAGQAPVSKQFMVGSIRP